MIKASVVIPVYNNPVGLKKVLSSLVEQDFPRDQYDIIVADNGSTDNTLDVAKKYIQDYSGIIKYVEENTIKSSYASRNKGIEIAKGEVIAFTDSDCIPAVGWLSRGYDSLIENKASMVAGKIEFTFKNSKPNIWEYFDAAGKLNQKSYVENAGFGTTANLFVRNEMFYNYGLFLSDLESGGDYEFGRRLTQSGESLVYCENALVFHPARATFRDKLNKSKRVARGQKHLSEMGLLNHGRLSWKQLIPIINYSSLSKIKIGVVEKILLVFINNFFKYMNFFWRCTYRKSK